MACLPWGPEPLTGYMRPVGLKLGRGPAADCTGALEPTYLLLSNATAEFRNSLNSRLRELPEQA